MELKQVDLILHARWVIPIVPRGFFENYSLVVQATKILDLLPTDKCKTTYKGTREVDLSEDHVLIPGLINTHCHTPMSLLRGFAEDCVLMDWLLHYMWPAEGRWVSEEFVELGSSVSILELLKNGVTCFNDMYFFPEVTAKVVEKCGMRALIGSPIIMFPSTYAKNQSEYLEKAKLLLEEFKNHERVKIAVSPHSLYTVDNDGLTQSKQLANQYSTKVHIHVHETEMEVVNHLNDSTHGGIRPLERLNRLGLVDHNLIAIHMTQLLDEEIQLISQREVSVASCPSSNLKLASGICPLNKLFHSKVNVSFGTDGAASNDGLCLLTEMRLATLLDRNSKPNVLLHGCEMLEMATLNGAKALGLDNQIGSLEIGKEADVVAIKLDSLPVFNPINTLTYVGTNKVEHVWVAGKCLVENGNLTTLDVTEIKKKAKELGKQIHQWDLERRKTSLEEIEQTLRTGETLRDSSNKQEIEQTLKQLQNHRDSLFHWNFFATLPEYPTTSPSQQQLQTITNLVHQQIDSLSKLGASS